MIIKRSPICRIISLILIAAIMFTIAGCSAAPPIPVISDTDNQTVTEHIETENIITEEELTEFITSEIYLQEIVLAENKISELLLEEETITEVICCKTIYVPQGHIEEFAENSQTAELFGEGLDLKSLLAKIAVGTGVIVTVVVLSKAGLPQPIASVVTAAADKSLEFAKNGAAIGSLFGGLTGAANEIDDAGILSAVIGTVYGGTEGYEYYHKYNTPYSSYENIYENGRLKQSGRLSQTPREGEHGSWTGKRGESDFVLDDPIELPDGTKITKVTYKNGIPDFSPYMKAEVKIPNMTDNRISNYAQARKVLAEYWTKIKFQDKTWTANDVKTYVENNNLVWHEMSNMDYMQLVPSEVNKTFTHFGGVAEYNTMTKNGVETDFE